MNDRILSKKDFDILIVEDDAMLKRVISLQLTLAGFPVRTAGFGQEALNMIREQIPSILILDIGLPDMSGFDVVEQLRKDPSTCNMPLIVHTSLVLTDAQIEQLHLGRTKVVTKTIACSDSMVELVIELAGSCAA